MAFSDPKQIIQASGLQAGATVADFGAGSGHYSFAAARAVSGGGRVIALDIQKELLARLKREAQAQGLNNVEIIWGDIEKEGGSGLKDESVDMVLLANILFQVSHRDAVLTEAFRVLKRGGRVLLVDWEDSFGGIGPKPADVLPKLIGEELLRAHRFTIERELKEAGEHHYGLIAQKP
jgi:ubiquinone/menaquinone biosynthesis C-methylase UbiE